jgi:hypothetical protein
VPLAAEEVRMVNVSGTREARMHADARTLTRRFSRRVAADLSFDQPSDLLRPPAALV